MSDAATSDKTISDKVSDLRHMALRNALYHTARYRFLDGVNKWFNLFVILGGTGAVTEVVRSHSIVAMIFGVGIAAIGALQLVFDYAGRAHRHEGLQRRYYEMLADIDCEISPTIEKCAKWLGEISRIAADAPPTMRALDVIADNQATTTLLGGDIPRLKIGWFRSATRQLSAHNGGKFNADPDWKPADDR